MPQKSKYKLQPLNLRKETLGKRIARLRKERGYTQVELAKKIGITQALISSYERNRLRPNYEMIIRFALALEVTGDEILGLKVTKKPVKPTLAVHQKQVKKIKANVIKLPTKKTASPRNIPSYKPKSKEEYMNNNQRKHIEDILLTLRQDLKEAYLSI